MILMIDTTGKEFLVTRAAQPKDDNTGKQRTDRNTGKPMWGTQVVVTDDDGGEVITITTVGSRPTVQVGDYVELLGLQAIPWTGNGRSGVAYRADDIKAIED